MAFFENGTVDDVADVLLVPLGEEKHGFGVASWCVQKTRAVDVFADAFENGA